MQVWGVHNDTMGAQLVEGGFISMGWDRVPDLSTIGDDRTLMKAALERLYPEGKPGAIPVWAGQMLRFGFRMTEGDVVVAPYKQDSTINFGRVVGPYYYDGAAPVHRHRRRVEWMTVGVSRAVFPQEALFEIGSALTLFKVSKHVEAFRPYFERAHAPAGQTPAPELDDEQPEALEAWVAEEPTAARVEQFTRDFVQRRLLTELSHREFEEYAADLLRAMGYQARVTPYSTDGGIDVIAHRDPLGLEPPIVKVQVKHMTASHSRPDVQRLIGTLAAGELGLFMTLGSYSSEAVGLERERQNLRLLSGADVVSLTLSHYDKLPERWQTRLPLRAVFAVARDDEGR